jgi:hypothetical protein
MGENPMGELRIDIKYKPIRHYRRDFIIGFLLLIIPIIVDIILIILGIRFYFGYFSIMIGIIIIGVQLYFLWKVPLYMEMKDLGIYFHHWRDFSKGPKFIAWKDVESIWPANKIRLKDGKERNINFLDRSDLDNIVDFLIMHDLSHLIKGRYSIRMDSKRPKKKPNISMKRKGGGKDDRLYFKVLIVFFAVCECIFLVGMGISILIVEVEACILLLLCSIAVPVVEVYLFFRLKKPVKTMILSISPSGVRFRKGSKKDIFFKWKEIADVSSDCIMLDYVTNTISIRSVDGRYIGFNDDLINRKKHTELFWALNEYCLYYGIPVRDGAKHLKIKRKGK